MLPAILLALLTSFVGALPLLLRGKTMVSGLYGGGSFILWFFCFYLGMPSLAYPVFGYVGAAAACTALIAAIIMSFMEVDGSRFNRHRISTGTSLVWGRIWAVPTVLLFLFAVRGCAGCEMINASDYHSLIGKVETKAWTPDVQQKNPDHVRQVPYDLAVWEANKQLGSADGAIGSQFHVDNDHMTIQMVKGQLWWVAPLEFNGFWKWFNAKKSPGYVMVSAERPNEPAVMVLGQTMYYTPEAYWHSNLERQIWREYADRVIDDLSFEVDEDGKPFWVATILHPSISFDGLMVDGVVIVDPTNGNMTLYPKDKVPTWVDRVIPASLINDYINWWGRYADGWWNGRIDNKDTKMADAAPALVYGANGDALFFADITSTNPADQSIMGVMYVNSRTGEATYMRTKGMTEEAVLSTVNSKVSYKNQHGSGPTIYNLYGTLASVVPILGANHTFQGVAIVHIETQEVALGDDIESALREYQAKLSKNHGGLTSEVAHATESLHAVIQRLGSEVKDGKTIYHFTVVGRSHIFVAEAGTSETLPLAREGDEALFVYIKGEKDIVPIKSFNDLTVMNALLTPKRPTDDKPSVTPHN